MSNSIIDEQIVLMKFDNDQFEDKINDTLVMLDNFRKSIDFGDSIKGIDNLGSAFAKVDLSNLVGQIGSVAPTIDTTLSKVDELNSGMEFGDAIQGVGNLGTSLKGLTVEPLEDSVTKVSVAFNALQTAAETVISNLTTSMMNFGQKMVNELFVDQITAGWGKLEEKTRGVATIMNATGKDIDEVNDSLAILNWYTDETSYNYTDMVSNIGKFTSAGVELDDAVQAMMGISNLAAVSGQGINEASRAMYNLAQSMSSGSLMLKDWMSIENANMATVEFKQALIDAAVAAGTLEEGYDGLLYATTTNSKGSLFEDAVSATENFRDSLSYNWVTTDVLMDALMKYGDYAAELYKVADGYDTCAEAMEHFDGTGMELGEKAFRAAQEAKTIGEAIDSVKDAVSTGWMQSFEIIFGNYHEAKKLYTDLANELWDVFASGGEARNEWLEEGLGAMRSFNKAAEELEIPNVEEFYKVFKDVCETDDLSFDDIIKEYGSLSAAFESGVFSVDQVRESLDKYIEEVKNMSVEEREALGIHSQDIEALDNLKLRLDSGQLSLESFIETASQQSGRQNLIDSFFNAFHALVKIVDTFKDAFREVFPPATAEQLYRFTEKLKNFTEKLEISDRTAQKLKSTMKIILVPIHAIIESVKSLARLLSPLESAAGSAFGALLSKVLDVTEAIGEFFWNFEDRVYSGDVFGVFGEKAVRAFGLIGTALSGTFENFKKFYNFVTSVEDWGVVFDALKRGGIDRENVLKWMGLYDIYNVVRTAFSPAIEYIDIARKAIYDKLSLFMPDVMAIFDDISTTIKNHPLLSSVGEFVSAIIQPIGNIFSGVKDGIITNFSGLGDVIEPSLLDVRYRFDNLKTAWSEVIHIWSNDVSDYVANNNAKASLLEHLANLRDSIVNFGSNIFTASSSVISGIFAKVCEILGSLCSGLGERVRSLTGATKEFLADNSITDFASFMAKIGDGICWVFDRTLEAVKAVFHVIKYITGQLEGEFTFENLMKGIKIVSNVIFGYWTGKKALSLFQNINGIKELFSRFFGLFKTDSSGTMGIVNALDSISESIENFTKESKSDLIKSTGIAIGIFAASLFALSFVDKDKLITAIEAITVCIAELVGSLKLLTTKSDSHSILPTKDLTTLMMKLSTSMLVLSFAMAKIGNMDWEQIRNGVTGLVAVLTTLVGGIFIFKYMDIDSLDMVGPVSAALIKFAVGLYMMGIAFKKLSNLDPEKLAAVVPSFTAILLAVGIFFKLLLSENDGLLAMSRGTSDSDIDGVDTKIMHICKALRKFALAFAIIALSLTPFTKMDDGGFVKVIGVISAILAMILAIGKMDIDPSQIDAMTKGIKKICGAVIELGIAFLLFKMIEYDEIIKGLGSVGIAITELGTVSAIMSKVAPTFDQYEEIGRGVDFMAKAMMKIAIAALMFKAFGIVGDSIFNSPVLMAIASVGAILTELLGLAALAKTFKIDTSDLKVVTYATVMANDMAGLMAKLAIISLLYKAVQYEDVFKALAALSGVLLAVGVFYKLVGSGSSRGFDGVCDGLKEIGLAMIFIAGACWILAHGGENLTGGALTALAALVAMLAGVSWASEHIKKENIDSLGKGILYIAAGLLLMAPAIKIFSSIGIEGALGALIILAGVLGSVYVMGKFLAPMSEGIIKVGKALMSVSGSALVFSLAMLGVAAALVLLAFVVNVAGLEILGFLSMTIVAIAEMLPLVAYQIGIAIGALIEGLSVSLHNAKEPFKQLLIDLIDIIVECIPYLTESTLKLVDSTLDALIQYGPGIITKALDILEVFLEELADRMPELSKSFISIAGSFLKEFGAAIRGLGLDEISDVILAFITIALSLKYFAAAGSFGMAAVKGVFWVGLVLAEIMGIIAIIGMIKQLPMVEELMRWGGDLFGLLGEAIGKLIGGLVGGFTVQSASVLPTVGAYLSDFMTNAGTFFNGIAELDGVVIPRMESIVSTIAKLGSDVPHSNVAQWDEFFNGIATTVTTFASTVSQLDDTAITDSERVATIMNSLVDCANKVPGEGGLLQAITGTKNLKSFAEGLAEFGPAVATLAENVKDLTEDQVEKIKLAVKATDYVIDMSRTIENEGGMLADLIGDNSLSMFAKELSEYGTELMKLVDEVEGFTDEDVATIKRTTEATQSVIDMSKTIGNEGGFLAQIIGDNTLSMFASHLQPFAEAMVKYSYLMAIVKLEGIEKTTPAISAIVDFANRVPTSYNSFVEFFTGSMDIDDFGDKLVNFAERMYDYGEAADQIDIQKVKKGISVQELLFDSVEKFNELPYEKEQVFGSVVGFIPSLAYALGDLAKGTEDLDMDSLQQIVGYIQTLSEVAVLIKDDQLNGFQKLNDGIRTLSQADFTALLSVDMDALKELGTSLLTLGKTLTTYSSQCEYLSVEAIGRSVTAMDDIVTVNSALKSINKDMWGRLGDEFVNYGANLVTFSTGMGTFDAALFSLAINSTNQLIELADAIRNVDSDILADFANVLPDLGGGISEFVNAFAQIGTNSILNATSVVKELGEMAKQLMSLDDTGLLNFVQAMNDIATLNIDAFVKAFTDAGEKTKAASHQLVDDFIAGVKDKQGQAVDRFNRVVTACLEKIKNNYDNFKESGRQIMIHIRNGINSVDIQDSFRSHINSSMQTFGNYYSAYEGVGTNIAQHISNGVSNQERTFADVVQNLLNNAARSVDTYNPGNYIGMEFANGITRGVQNNTDSVDNAVRVVSESIIGGTKGRLMIKSPSKVAESLGNFWDQGLANGITNGFSTVNDATNGVAGNLIDKFKSVIGDNLGFMENDTSKAVLDTMQQFSDEMTGNFDILKADSLDMDKLMKDMGYDLGDNWVDGVVSGMSDGNGLIQAEAMDGALDSLYGFGDTIKDNTGILSDETLGATGLANSLGYGLGDSWDEGIASGIYGNNNVIQAASSDAALDAIRAFGNTIDDNGWMLDDLGEQSAVRITGIFDNALGDTSMDLTSMSKDSAETITGMFDSAVTQTNNLIDQDLNTEPVITPVVDLSNVEAASAQTERLFSDTTLSSIGTNFEIANQIRQIGATQDPTQAILSNLVAAIADANGQMINDLAAQTDPRSSVKALEEIRDELSEIRDMGIYLDSGQLVGGIARPMDTALGRISQKRRRGS